MSVLEYINSDIFSPVYQNGLPPVKSESINNICKELYYAIKEEQVIMVYGDYDMDGFCAALVWRECMALITDKVPVIFKYVQRTHKVDRDLVRQAKSAGAELVIICDAGSSAEDRSVIDMLGGAGIRVIVIDHHVYEGDYQADSKTQLMFNSCEESELLGHNQISGAYASLLVAQTLCLEFFKAPLSYNAEVYALASMYSDVVDLSTPPGRALYNVVSFTKAPGPLLLQMMNEWDYGNTRRFFSFIIAPMINACFRMEEFSPLNQALSITDRYSLKPVAEEFKRIHVTASDLVKTVTTSQTMFSKERFGELLLYIHEATEETRILHIRNFTGLIANQFSKAEKCAVVVVVHDGSEYNGSFRDFYNRPMLPVFKLFCTANGHPPAFGITFYDVAQIKRNLESLGGRLESGAEKDYTTLSSHLIESKEDVQALALYNDYMNLQPKILVTHRCPYAKLVRGSKYRKIYDIGLPYNVSLTSPLLEGSNVLIEPCICKDVELRGVE